MGNCHNIFHSIANSGPPSQSCAYGKQFLRLQYAVCRFQTIHSGKATKKGIIIYLHAGEPIILIISKFQIFFHGKDMKSLTSHIDPAALPKRYGGTLNVPDLKGNDLYELFQLYKKEFECEIKTKIFTKYLFFESNFFFIANFYSGQLFWLQQSQFVVLAVMSKMWNR